MPRSRDTGFTHPQTFEITSRAAYERRRDWLKLIGSGVAGAAMAASSLSVMANALLLKREGRRSGR